MTRSIGAIGAALVLLVTSAEYAAAQTATPTRTPTRTHTPGPSPTPTIAQCTNDAACDDGVFCNGAELCKPKTRTADIRGCVRSSTPRCPAGQTCNEAADTCTGCQTDADGDDAISTACGGTDCDDDDPFRFPGNTEICQLGAEQHDEDCNPQTFGNRDADGDRWVSRLCCNQDPTGALHCGPDCNDGDPSVHPSNGEVCDGIDNDCDGTVDEGVRSLYFEDGDSDGYGFPDFGDLACAHHAQEFHLVPNNYDCNDNEPSVGPGSMICLDESGGVICSDGQFSVSFTCESRCITQPNGTGVCE